MKVLVLGCARSGTRFLTQVLQNAGLQIEHEKDGEDGCVTSFLAAPPPYPGDRHKPRLWPAALAQFDHVWQVVREPVKTIASCTGLMKPLRFYDSFVRQHIGDPEMWVPGERGQLIMATYYWIRWNARIRPLVERTFNIEELPEVWGHLARDMGVALDWPSVCNAERHSSEKARFRQLLFHPDGREEGRIVTRSGPMMGLTDVTAMTIENAVGPGLYEELREAARLYGYHLPG